MWSVCPTEFHLNTAQRQQSPACCLPAVVVFLSADVTVTGRNFGISFQHAWLLRQRRRGTKKGGSRGTEPLIFSNSSNLNVISSNQDLYNEGTFKIPVFRNLSSCKKHKLETFISELLPQENYSVLGQMTSASWSTFTFLRQGPLDFYPRNHISRGWTVTPACQWPAFIT